MLFSGDAIPVPGEMPVYEDVLASVASIKKLKAIKDISHLLQSWDEPRKGHEAYQRMDEGLQYMQRIHEVVLKVSENGASGDPMDLCRRALTELGLPPEVANPLVAKSFAAHLAIREHPDLLVL